MKISKRDSKFIGLALAASAGSTYTRVRIGAVLVSSNGLYVSGANLCTSHPLQKHYNDRVGRLAPQHNLHAEMHCLVKGLRPNAPLRGGEIYVGRYNRKGNLAMCKPCPACEAALRSYNISRAVYTSPTGIQEERYEH